MSMTPNVLLFIVTVSSNKHQGPKSQMPKNIRFSFCQSKLLKFINRRKQNPLGVVCLHSFTYMQHLYINMFVCTHLHLTCVNFDVKMVCNEAIFTPLRECNGYTHHTLKRRRYDFRQRATMV